MAANQPAPLSPVLSELPLSSAGLRYWTRRFFGERPAEVLSILLASSLLIAAIIFMHRFAHRFGMDTRWVFTKEGPIEQLTWIAGIIAVCFCAAATRERWHMRDDVVNRWLALGYGCLAAGLFVFTMEEISWTQTYLRFATPESWAAINHQQETTLHNLLDREQLEPLSRMAGLALSAVGLLLIAAGLLLRHRFIAGIAPHWSLAPFLLMLAYASTKTHSEVVEALLPVFFCFFGYQIYRQGRVQRAERLLSRNKRRQR
jgi:hypothetical protein